VSGVLDPRNARVLLTGGAGFIGSAVLWELNRRGCERVVVCDVLGTSEKWKNLAPLRHENYVEASELFERLRSGALGSFDLVIHLGAESSTTEKDVAYLIRNNYEFTKDLAAWSLEKGARFIYASSAATYGDGSAGMSDDEPDLSRLQPLNPYGYSKHLFDVHAKREGWLDGIAGLKYFNVFGPNEDHKGDMRSVVHKSFQQIRDTGSVRLFKSHRPDFKDGEQKRDFLYVKDAVAMTLHLALNRTLNGLFNLGSGEARTWLDLVTPVFEAMDREPSVAFVDMPVEIRDKYQYFTQADIGKIRRAGFDAPLTPLRDAIFDYVRNYLSKDRRLFPADPRVASPSAP
jgi:ADP-L-glycero-D-manno-heptose 6-epimerase